MAWDAQLERQLLARACADSFWQFFLHAWGAAYGPKYKSWVDEDIHRPICEWYEHHIRQWLADRKAGIKRQMRLAPLVPREYGKTILITKVGQTWLHLQDPDLSTYTGSETIGRAIEFLSSIQSVLSGSDEYARFAWLYGNWKHKDRAWSINEIEHAARRATARSEPSFGTFGVEKGLTGTHPDAIFFDDPTSYEAIQNSTGWLAQVNNTFDSLIPVLTSDGLFVIPGTRYGDGDHFGRLFRADGIASLTGMAMDDEVGVTPEGKWHVYFLQGRDKQKNPTYPKQWPGWRLDEYEKKNNLRFAAQIMNDPASSEFNPLNYEMLRSMIVKPEHVPGNLLFTIHCDTAFRYPDRIRTTCESTINVWGHHPATGDVYYIEGYGSTDWSARDYNNELVKILQRLYRRKTWHPKIAGRWPYKLTDDAEPGGKTGVWELTLETWCKNVGLPCPPVLLISRQNRRGGKDTRLIQAAAHWTDPNHNVKLVENAPGLEELCAQMVKLLTSEMRDRADACADVFHPDCYVAPPRLGIKQPGDVEPELPGDEIIRPRQRRMSDEEAMKLYDAYHNREADIEVVR